MARDEYEKGYDEGYDEGYDRACDESWKEAYDQGWEDAIADTSILRPDLKNDNLCLKCDCREHGLDCVLQNPRAYMEQKIEHGDKKPRKRPRVKNPDFDRAMEIFHPY